MTLAAEQDSFVQCSERASIRFARVSQRWSARLCVITKYPDLSWIAADLKKRQIRAMPRRKRHCRMHTISRRLSSAYYAIPWSFWETMDPSQDQFDAFPEGIDRLTSHLIV